MTSPWLTTKQVAEYARRHKDTVLAALREYQRTNGRSGLKGRQERANCAWRIHVEDVDRWMAGEAPARGTRKFQVAS